MALTANKIFWTEFIESYRSLQSLWNTKDENYNNRESRSLGWKKLVKKLQEVEPDASQDSVKRKINTFRSNFNREVRKIRHSQKKQPKEVYNPTLWYFDHLSFLLNQEGYNNKNGVPVDSHYDDEITLMGLKDVKNEKNMENETVHSESINPDHMTNSEQNSQCSKFTVDNENLQTESTNPAPESVRETRNLASSQNHISPLENIIKSTESKETTTIARKLNSNIKRAKLRLKSQSSYSRHHFRNYALSSPSTDEATIYGQAWICDFRKLSHQQKIFAKKAIDEILILGQLKVLKLNTVQMNTNLFEETMNQS